MGGDIASVADGLSREPARSLPICPRVARASGEQAAQRPDGRPALEPNDRDHQVTRDFFLRSRLKRLRHLSAGVSRSICVGDGLRAINITPRALGRRVLQRHAGRLRSARDPLRLLPLLARRKHGNVATSIALGKRLAKAAPLAENMETRAHLEGPVAMMVKVLDASLSARRAGTSAVSEAHLTAAAASI